MAQKIKVINPELETLVTSDLKKYNMKKFIATFKKYREKTSRIKANK